MRGHNPRFAPIMLDFEMPMFLSNSSMHRSPSHFSSMSSPKISEEMQKLLDSLEFDTLHAPSRVTSSKKVNGDEIAEAALLVKDWLTIDRTPELLAIFGLVHRDFRKGFCVVQGLLNARAYLLFSFSRGQKLKEGAVTRFFQRKTRHPGVAVVDPFSRAVRISDDDPIVGLGGNH